MEVISFPQGKAGTETPEEIPLLLADRIAQNPQAFDFSNIATPTDAEMDAGLLTLEMAIGDYSPIDGHDGFYFKAPKLREQLAITRFCKGIQGVTDEEEALLQIVAMGKRLFYVLSGDDFRLATEDEILDNFNMGQMFAIIARYGGLSYTEQGK
jgi:hypothetical protein